MKKTQIKKAQSLSFDNIDAGSASMNWISPMIRDLIPVMLLSSSKAFHCRMVCTAGYGNPFSSGLFYPYLRTIRQVTLEFTSEDSQHINDFIKRDMLLKTLSAFKPVDIILVLLRHIFSSLKDRFIKSVGPYQFGVMHYINNSIKLTHILSGLIIFSYTQISD